MDTAILIGARGWDNDEWVGGFYPDDLPDDWRLGYYSNRLRAVLVPAGIWQGQPEFDTWLEDIDPGFRLVLEWQLDVDTEDAQAVCSKIAERIQAARVLADNVDAWLLTLSGDGDVDGAVVEAVVKRMAEWRPVCLELGRRTLSPDTLSTLKALGVSFAWQADSGGSPDGSGKFLVAISSAADARGQREIIGQVNDWAEQSGQERRGAAVFFTGPAAADHAAQARVVAEMMGV